MLLKYCFASALREVRRSGYQGDSTIDLEVRVGGVSTKAGAADQLGKSTSGSQAKYSISLYML